MTPIRPHSVLSARTLFGLFVAVFISSALPAKSSAAMITYTYPPASLPVGIPDEVFGIPGEVVLDINVTDSFNIASFDSVSIGLTHTFVGDLIATLTHVPTGTTIDLFNRVGRDGSGFGSSSNLNGTYTFTNLASYGPLNTLRDAVAGQNDSFDVPSGFYNPTTSFSVGTEPVTNLNTAFDGLNVSGIWRLTISDNAGGDTGNITSFSFTVNDSGSNSVATPVPATAPMALLAFTGFVALRRRYRRAA